MTVLRLGLCVAGVYSMFLIWAVVQERLSTPFARSDGSGSDKFRSIIITNTLQSFFAIWSSFFYILFRRRDKESLEIALGLNPSYAERSKHRHLHAHHTHAENGHGNGYANGKGHGSHFQTSELSLPPKLRDLLTRYLHCALFITFAQPFGFAALDHISYPLMVLGKSCKLVPVMIMNILLYRRKFAPHKYLVVAMVTTGIAMFSFYGEKGGKSNRSSSSFIGLLYLFINLALDGATNSTQDEIFDRYKLTGQQMMFWLNIMCTLLQATIAAVPLPTIPVLHPSPGGQSELSAALTFAREHPGVITPLFLYALCGSIGQLFIFETLQHFGSLTLVTVTLTRKLFTMLISVVVYKHKLTTGQWLGTGVVFCGISVEAWIKRRDVHAKKVIQEKEKAEIKTL